MLLKKSCFNYPFELIVLAKFERIPLAKFCIIDDDIVILLKEAKCLILYLSNSPCVTSGKVYFAQEDGGDKDHHWSASGGNSGFKGLPSLYYL